MTRVDLGGLGFKAAQCGLQRQGAPPKFKIVDGPLGRDTHFRFLRRGERENLVLVLVERMHQFPSTGGEPPQHNLGT